MKVNEPAAIDWRGNRRGPFTVNLNLATQTTNWKQTRRTKPADTIPDCVDVFSCFRRAVTTPETAFTRFYNSFFVRAYCQFYVVFEVTQ